MRRFNRFGSLAAVVVGLLLIPATARASTIQCENDPTKNYMEVDTSIVSACLAAGFSNPSLTGDQLNDVFMNGAGSGYDYVGPTAWTQNNNTGTFYFDSSLWNTYSNIAVAFKFGTGNKPDNWFVYSLKDLLTSGYFNWTFINLFNRGGGLSGVYFYGIPSVNVPEPASLAFVLFGLLTFAALSRRMRRFQTLSRPIV